MAQDNYGRHRKSIAGIEDELSNLMSEHPLCHFNEGGEPVVPGHALVDIFARFSESHDDVELMSKDEENQLIQFLASNESVEATPKVLIEFIAIRTTASANASAQDAAGALSSDEGSENESSGSRGRQARGAYHSHSRSSSTDSTGTSVYQSASRPSSRGPVTPGRDSVFDTSKRQRSTPLAAPSSWTKRPLPASRRKSDAGGRASSDSESALSTPSARGNRKTSRSRVPSNPTSPTMSSPPANSPPSRPHSRSQSYSQTSYNLNGLDSYYGSPDRGGQASPTISAAGFASISPPGSADNSLDEQSFLSSINSLQMPRPDDDSDSDSDGEDPSMLIYDRSAASSTASLEPMERLEALQRMNTDLSKKLIEAERMLQNRLTEHEMELEEMQGRLEEAKSELTATKKEEKELRAKERQNSTQISALESEIAKFQKNLDNARVSYQSLQKQYQEQCSESERYRNTLRRRDQEIKDYQDAAALQVVENQKWLREQAEADETIKDLEHSLTLAREAYVDLESQKQENMLLKETIDRMRFDLDEMRSNAAASAQQGNATPNSARGSLSRSFQDELRRAGFEPDAATAPPPEDPDLSSDTVVPDMEENNTDDEDYIQTIITKTRKRKVPGRPALPTLQMEEVIKEYADAWSQYDPTPLVQSSTQTEPEPVILKASFSIQTEDTPVTSFSIQTDPEPVPPPRVTFEADIQTDSLEPIIKITAEVEIQTDEPEPEPEQESAVEDASASSSSTLLPPTPRAEEKHLHDLPPAYNQVNDHDSDELALRIANETLKQWHKGAQLPIEPLRSGVSLDAIEEWRSLKEELGVECTVIDKILEESRKTNQPRPSTSSLSASTSSKASTSSSSSRSSRGGRFYNIYNTYVYGGGGSSDLASLATNVLFCVGASAAVVFFMTHGSAPYVIPGGPTYYDRAAWSSFNTMQPHGEGFAGDGTSVVWSFLGRFAGGAARIVQGWPT